MALLIRLTALSPSALPTVRLRKPDAVGCHRQNVKGLQRMATTFFLVWAVGKPPQTQSELDTHKHLTAGFRFCTFLEEFLCASLCIKSLRTHWEVCGLTKSISNITGFLSKRGFPLRCV